MKLVSTATLLALGAICPFALHAKEVAPFVGISFESHSNVQRIQAPEIADTKIRPYAGIEYEDETGDYETSINIEVSAERYADETFDSNTFLEADAYLDWLIIPGRFSWAIEDYAGQYRINIQEPDVPSNIQTVNVFATGPDFLFSRGAGDILLKARYADVSYWETEDDSSRFIGAASLQRTINPVSSFNIDSTISVVRFDQGYFDDYNVFTTGLRYNRELPYGNFYGALGYNGFDFESGKTKNDPYYDLNFRLDLSAASSINFTSAFKLTDLALEAFNPLYTRLLSDLQLTELTAETGERGASGVYRVQRLFGGYNFTGQRVSAEIYGFYNEQNYFDLVANNFDEIGVGVSVGYELSSQLRLRAGISQSDVEYLNAPADVDNPGQLGFDVEWVRSELVATYNFRDNFFIVAGVSREDSESINPRRDFADDVISLAVEYRAQPKLIN